MIVAVIISYEYPLVSEAPSVSFRLSFISCSETPKECVIWALWRRSSEISCATVEFVKVGSLPSSSVCLLMFN